MDLPFLTTNACHQLLDQYLGSILVQSRSSTAFAREMFAFFSTHSMSTEINLSIWDALRKWNLTVWGEESTETGNYLCSKHVTFHIGSIRAFSYVLYLKWYQLCLSTCGRTKQNWLWRRAYLLETEWVTNMFSMGFDEIIPLFFRWKYLSTVEALVWYIWYTSIDKSYVTLDDFDRPDSSSSSANNFSLQERIVLQVF